MVLKHGKYYLCFYIVNLQNSCPSNYRCTGCVTLCADWLSWSSEYDQREAYLYHHILDWQTWTRSKGLYVLVSTNGTWYVCVVSCIVVFTLLFSVDLVDVRYGNHFKW